MSIPLGSSTDIELGGFQRGRTAVGGIVGAVGPAGVPRKLNPGVHGNAFGKAVMAIFNKKRFEKSKPKKPTMKVVPLSQFDFDMPQDMASALAVAEAVFAVGEEFRGPNRGDAFKEKT